MVPGDLHIQDGDREVSIVQTNHAAAIQSTRRVLGVNSERPQAGIETTRKTLVAMGCAAPVNHKPPDVEQAYPLTATFAGSMLELEYENGVEQVLPVNGFIDLGGF